jgi:hypothetical protein
MFARISQELEDGDKASTYMHSLRSTKKRMMKNERASLIPRT